MSDVALDRPEVVTDGRSGGPHPDTPDNSDTPDTGRDGEPREVEGTDGAARRRFWPAMVGILVIALGVRLVYVLVFTSHGATRIYDAVYYNLESGYLAKGYFFTVPFSAGPDASHPPLTSLVITPATYLFGIPHGEVPQRLTMAVLGVAVVLFVGMLGRAVAGPRVGLVAALIAALYPNFWIPNGIVMSETLAMLLMALILLVIYRLWRRPTWPNAALLGLGCGTEILVRAELVLFVPFLLVPAVVACRVPGRKRWALGAVGILVCLATLAPWVARNEASFHDATYVSTGEGLVLIGANCPAAYSGPGLGLWRVQCPEAVTAKGDASQYSTAYQHAALTYISHHEGRLPIVVAARIGRIWDAYEPAQMAAVDVNEGRPEGAALAGLACYYALLPVAVLGIVHLRRRRHTQWPLLVPAGILTVVAALTYGTVRFRAPFEVCLAVLAAAGVEAILRWRARPPGAPRPPRTEPTTTAGVDGPMARGR